MIRHAEARWEGTLKDGQGNLKTGSGALEGPYTFKARFEEGPETNPEELLGAAHAGCFSMALAARLTAAGSPPVSIATKAAVHLNQVDGAWTINRIDLETEASVPGITEATFVAHAEEAKKGCPVSKALAGPEITLAARLV